MILIMKMCRALALFLFPIILHSGCAENNASSFTGSAVYNPQGWQVYFSPLGGCTKAVVGEVNHARQSILVQSYSFTSRPIARALVEAYKRGVKVEVIFDAEASTEARTQFGFLRQAGMPVNLDAAHTIAHNKIMIIDDETVITGSFNFTTAAEKYNAENLLIIHDKKMADLYTSNWQLHRAHSQPAV